MTEQINDYTEEDLLEYEKELKKYYLTCLLMEGSKTLLFLLIFGYLHLMKEFLMALFTLMVLRNHGGGIHCRHYISCFAVSFIVLYAGITIPLHVRLPLWILLLLLLISTYTGYRLVPIVSESRPEPTPAQTARCRKITVAVILIYSLMVCIRPENSYILIGVWTIYIHILQLCIAKLTKGGR